MKIEYISSDGIHAVEKAAIDRMRQAFNGSQFSQKWHGFAAFMMMDRVLRDREIDLILLTHDRLLLLELKNWNNGKIAAMNDHWLLAGNDMGRSPVKVTADKCKILASKLHKLREPARSVWNEYRVVICGNADISGIDPDERRYVVTLDHFLKISTSGAYEKMFGRPRQNAVRACDHVVEFGEFFKGPQFKPTAFSFNNFQIVGDVIFPHPTGLYKEYKSVKKDDFKRQALLRRWDFSALAGVADTIDERANIALREHKALGYIHDQNEQLDEIVLQPLTFPTRDDVDAGFCELYQLPSRQARLSEFVNRYGADLKPPERLGIVKVLVSHFANLHDLGVAHRDVADHSVWLERPARVSISGLVTAHFPQIGTVGGIRDVLRAGGVSLPEDAKGLGEGTASDPFRRDVYLLGVVCFYLLHLKWPPKDAGVHFWEETPGNEFGLETARWLKKSLELSPGDRFANAREMLNALTKITLGPASETGLDFRVFEPFKTELLPNVVFRSEEEVKHGHSHVYRSIVGGQNAVVKIWYSIRPDPKRSEESHQILSFLEKARLLKAQKCSSVPNVIDFGLSPAGLYLVQSWAEGSSLQELYPERRSTREALDLCQAVIEATLHLHAVNLEHGDLSPSNIIISGQHVDFIDVLDIFPGGGRKLYNTSYSPAEYDSLPITERDCFAVATICGELLGSASPDVIDVADVLNEIGICLKRELHVYRLDRILDAVKRAIVEQEKPTIREFKVQLRNQTTPFDIAADNGSYHVGVFEDKQRPGMARLYVAGVRQQVLLSIDVGSRAVSWVGVRDIQHSHFVNLASRAIHSMEAKVTVFPGARNGAPELAEALLQLAPISGALDALSGISAGEEELTEVVAGPITTTSPPTSAIWKALIEAEESTLPEVEVVGQISWDVTSFSRVRVPYSKAGEPLDYDPEDTIEVLQEVHGELVRIGDLNLRETTDRFLVVERASARGSFALGERLKLRSVQDRSSFRRRQSAVTRILDREAVIPNLIDFFDPCLCPSPQQIDSGPSDTDLDVYNLYERGQLVFSLNAQQRSAFKRLWSNGPVGLLQGPPGTGKTAFIASFIHYALTKGARNILLASQSHEAVNNAAEKVLELCRKTSLPLDLVRFGAEGMVSDALRPYHSSAILQSHRELFRSEMRQRISSLSENLGLPRDFVEQWFDVTFHLGRLAADLNLLTAKLSLIPPSSQDRKELVARISRREERLRIVADEKFNTLVTGPVTEIIPVIHERLTYEYKIRSADAVARLNQALFIAQEWVDRLGTLRGNFEEFLAKTRSLVCGTCVGLGRSHFGIAKNRYDWVIVDEASRATPGELAVAIQTGARILLVGDHRQLPPLYTKEVIDDVGASLSCSDRALLTRSDFERAFESSYGKDVGAMLQVQYRMAPPIGDLVSSCFYPTPLMPGRSDPPEWFSLLPDCAKAVVTWIDTSTAGNAAREQKKKGETSCKNRFEVSQVLDVLRQIFACSDFMNRLYDEGDEDAQPIGVICGYADQKHLLQRSLSEQPWAAAHRDLVKIDTVDSYQGKENRIIILSLTRNNDRFEQGFLASPERANVSISRAMDRLIIVGAARMWRERNQQSPFGQILSYIEQHADASRFRLIEALGVKAEGVAQHG